MPKKVKPKKPDGRKNNKPPFKAADGWGKETRFSAGHQPKNKQLRTILKDKGLDRETINELFAEILSSNANQLTEMKLDNETTMLELIGISGIEAAIRSADMGRLEWFLTQIFGKQVQRTENLNFNVNSESVVTESDRERVNRMIQKRIEQSNAK